MTKNIYALIATLALCLGTSSSVNAITVLERVWYGFGPGISSLLIDESAFDVSTGLGTVTTTIMGEGTVNYSAYFDIDIGIDPIDFNNTDEVGKIHNTPLPFQSWEIDHPTEGDIIDNFSDRNLDKKIGFDDSGGTVFPNNVAMAMGWDVPITLGDKLLVMLTISTQAPLEGFYLEQLDTLSQTSVYLSGTLDLKSAVPLPAAFWLFGSALIGFIALSRRRVYF